MTTLTGKRTKIGSIQWEDDRHLKVDAGDNIEGFYLLNISYKQITYYIPLYIKK